MEEKVVKAKKTPEQKVDVQAFVSRKLNAVTLTKSLVTN